MQQANYSRKAAKGLVVANLSVVPFLRSSTCRGFCLTVDIARNFGRIFYFVWKQTCSNNVAATFESVLATL